MASLGTPPGRLNLRVVAGEPFELTVPILDGTGTLVSGADSPAWQSEAMIRTEFDSETALYEFTTSITAGNVLIQATAEHTAGWQDDWANFRNPWDLMVIDDDDEVHYICAGIVSLYTTITR